MEWSAWRPENGAHAVNSVTCSALPEVNRVRTSAICTVFNETVEWDQVEGEWSIDGNSTATCPGGFMVTGCSCYSPAGSCTSGSTALSSTVCQVTSARGLETGVYNPVRAVAICVKLAAASDDEWISVVSSPSDPVDDAFTTVQCATGDVLVGCSCYGDHACDGAEILANHTCEAIHNGRNSDIGVRAQAICIPDSYVVETEIISQGHLGYPYAKDPGYDQWTHGWATGVVGARQDILIKCGTGTVATSCGYHHPRFINVSNGGYPVNDTHCAATSVGDHLEVSGTCLALDKFPFETVSQRFSGWTTTTTSVTCDTGHVLTGCECSSLNGGCTGGALPSVDGGGIWTCDVASPDGTAVRAAATCLDMTTSTGLLWGNESGTWFGDDSTTAACPMDYVMAGCGCYSAASTCGGARTYLDSRCRAFSLGSGTVHAFAVCLNTIIPTSAPSSLPTSTPSRIPSSVPSFEPSSIPTGTPSRCPSSLPTSFPSLGPTFPTTSPSVSPTSSPSGEPTPKPVYFGAAIGNVVDVSRNGRLWILVGWLPLTIVGAVLVQYTIWEQSRGTSLWARIGTFYGSKSATVFISQIDFASDTLFIGRQKFSTPILYLAALAAYVMPLVVFCIAYRSVVRSGVHSIVGFFRRFYGWLRSEKNDRCEYFLLNCLSLFVSITAGLVTIFLFFLFLFVLISWKLCSVPLIALAVLQPIQAKKKADDDNDNYDKKGQGDDKKVDVGEKKKADDEGDKGREMSKDRDWTETQKMDVELMFHSCKLSEILFESVPQLTIALIDAVFHALQYRNDTTITDAWDCEKRLCLKPWFRRRLITPWFLFTVSSALANIIFTVWPYVYYIGDAALKSGGLTTSVVRKGLDDVIKRYPPPKEINDAKHVRWFLRYVIDNRPEIPNEHVVTLTGSLIRRTLRRLSYQFSEKIYPGPAGDGVDVEHEKTESRQDVVLDVPERQENHEPYKRKAKNIDQLGQFKLKPLDVKPPMIEPSAPTLKEIIECGGQHGTKDKKGPTSAWSDTPAQYILV